MYDTNRKISESDFLPEERDGEAGHGYPRDRTHLTVKTEPSAARPPGQPLIIFSEMFFTCFANFI